MNRAVARALQCRERSHNPTEDSKMFPFHWHRVAAFLLLSAAAATGCGSDKKDKGGSNGPEPFPLRGPDGSQQPPQGPQTPQTPTPGGRVETRPADQGGIANGRYYL